MTRSIHSFGAAALGCGLLVAAPQRAAADPPAGLIISEICDATLPGGLPKWVELTNCGPDSVDLSQYSLGNFNNGADTLSIAAVELSGVLGSGDSYVVSYENSDSPGSSIFYDVYGFDADNLDPGALINGDDAIVLFFGDALAGDPGDGSVTPVVDVYGVVGVDGSGEVWEYTDGYAYRNPYATATPVFDPSQWTFGGANSLETGDDAEELALILALTSPGSHNCEVPLDVLITEICDATLPGGLPKWVELTNCGPDPVNLSQYSLGNFNNGNDTLSTAAVGLSGTLGSGDSYVVSYENSDSPGSSIFYDVYGFDADNLDPGALINGNDAIVLFFGDALAGDPGDGSVTPVADVYGVVGVDGTGEPWEYTNSYAHRNPDEQPTPVFDPGQWTFGGPDALETGNDDEELELIQTLTNPGEHSCTAGCFTMVSQETVCNADGDTFTVNVEGFSACTGDTMMLTFTGSGGAVGQDLCFSVIITGDMGGFCCITQICVPVPDCSQPAQPPCDLDGDGTVGLLDFLGLLDAWGPCGNCNGCPADFNNDCTVGIADMLILMANWT